MNEDIAPFELGVKLKDKGFDEPCYGYYHCNGGNDSFELCGNGDRDFLNSKNQYRVAAPTIPQVLKWLREEKNIHIVIDITNYGFISSTISFKWVKSYCENEIEHYDHKGYSTNEEATLAEIEYVLDNLI